MRSKDWWESALCREVGVEPFFSTNADSTLYAKAKKVCEKCPVREDCLAWSLRHDLENECPPSGVWGGESPDSRRRMLLKMRIPEQTAVVGRAGRPRKAPLLGT